MDQSYDKILEKLSKISGIEKEEIDRRVEAKRAKLSGLISREGALQVIAAELGISFDEEKLKIDELLPGMRKVNFSGKVVTLYPIRTFKTKDGGEGKVANMIVADDTSNIKLVLWDTNHIQLLESGEVKEGTSIEIASGNMREGEVHMGSFSELKLSQEEFPEVVIEKPMKEKDISEFQVGDTVSTRAFVVQSFDPRFYQADPETGKKVTDEEIAGGSPAEKRAILNIVVDDGTENIRAVMFHEVVRSLGLTAYDDPDLMTQQKENLLGKEIIVSGDVRMNSYFNNPELIVNSVQEIDVDKLVSDLE
jgi:ssDNA-binding replication factor A large subunit